MIKRLACLLFGHTPVGMYHMQRIGAEIIPVWHCSCCGVFYNDDYGKHSATVNAKGEEMTVLVKGEICR